LSAAEAFSSLLGELEYPMLVVTAIADGQPSGCLVGFGTQCSIDPARYLVCLSDKNLTCRVAARSDGLAVHFLPAPAIDLARLFGSETGDDADKFARCEWHPGPRGLPIIDACRRWFAGTIVERMRLGDHVGHVLEPVAVQNEGDGALLGFQQVKELEPGHEA
jgi:flavin reductase (DIM6/NTAB) family NADH-FMN oxidoreductase RutF